MPLSERELKKAGFIIKKVAGLEIFEIEEFLGKGAFGSVVKAKLKNSFVANLSFAIKVIKIDNYENIRLEEKRFIENLYGKIKSCCPSCVVNIYPEYIREDFHEGDWDYFYYLVIVADYVPLTLRKFKGVFSKKWFPVSGHKGTLKEVLKIGIKLGEDCLTQFLKNGFIYTDLKPENVGIAGNLQPLILDIGGFKNLERFINFSKTLSQSRYRFQATPLYAPPEMTQALFSSYSSSVQYAKDYFEKELKDGRGTTYQLAATLIEPLTGQRVDFEKNLTLFRLTEYIEDENLKKLFQRALNQEREKRPPLEEFVEELQEEFYRLKKQFSKVQVKEKAKGIRGIEMGMMDLF